MHDIAKQVGAVFRTDIHNLDQIPLEDIEDVPHVWEGRTTEDESIRVSVWLGVLSLHIQQSGGEREIARVNLGRLAEINTRAERNISRLKAVDVQPATADPLGRKPLLVGGRKQPGAAVLRIAQDHAGSLRRDLADIEGSQALDGGGSLSSRSNSGAASQQWLAVPAGSGP